MKHFFNHAKTLLGSFLLSLLAIVLLLLILVIGMIYSIVTFFIKRKLRSGITLLANYFYNIAYSVDQTANVLYGPMWTDLFCIKETNKNLIFGDADKTISEQLGDNKYHSNLTKTGLFLSKILNFIDKNHIEKASSYYSKIK